LTIFTGIEQTTLSVLKALAPLVVLFVVFQLRVLRLPRSYVLNLIKGTALASVGLILFLQGVRIGFLPAGEALGEVLSSIKTKPFLVPLGFSLGFLTTWGEPAVRVLSDQVEKASAGFLRKKIVLINIAVGVASFIALGMAKIIYGIPLTYIIIPGYVLAIGLMWFSDRVFLSVAFDAGGVATGPLAVTFLMAVAVGITATMEGRDPIMDGFGLIALIALAPILSVMILGLIYRSKLRKEKNMPPETSLIVTIVGRGWGDTVLEASMRAGAEGGTILLGRGAGIHEKQKIMGIPIEPEKEIVLSVTFGDRKDAILEEIVRAAELDKPGKGIAFMVPIEKVVGIVHQGITS
jgi:nitrogen regulatory protein PII